MRQPGKRRLGAGRVGGRHALRGVEGSGQQLDDRPARVAVAERRAAGRAEVAHRTRGGPEGRRRAARPGEIAPRHLGQHGKRSGHRLLAHAAMADADLDGLGVDGKAHRAALAAAGVDGRAPAFSL